MTRSIAEDSLGAEQERFAQMTVAAISGDAKAQHWVAEAYRIGKNGVAVRDLAKSLEWYRKAAEQGYAAAQNDFGSMLLNGMGTDADAKGAVHWYRKAAEQESSDAQFNLALRYLHGSGVGQDDAIAAEWLVRAADHGHAEALGQLGTLFRFGRGVEQSYELAALCHLDAAIRGDAVAIGNLADYFHELRNAALGGSVDAATYIAKMFWFGIVVDKDAPAALSWLLLADQHEEESHSDETSVRGVLKSEVMASLSSSEMPVAYQAFLQLMREGTEQR